MDIKSFKQSLKQHKKICVVGPMKPKIPSQMKKTPQILVDGGTHVRHRHPIHITVGDGDSFRGRLDVNLPAIKNYTDFNFALKLIPKNIKELDLVGFLGGRKDHELVNLGEIQHFLSTKKNSKAGFYNGNTLKILALSKGKFKFKYTGTFSVVTFTKNKISVKGKCEYQVKRKQKWPALSGFGVSNIGFGAIELACDSVSFVFFDGVV